MPLSFPDVGENLALEMIVNKTAAQNLVLKLYSNDVTPGEADTAGTFTECAGSGYGALTLTGATWAAAAAGSIAYAQQTFTFTGALGNVYGYFVVQATSGTLVYAERFTSPTPPIIISNNGDQIKITPTITAS